jgi:hypothetical protein
MLPISSLRLLVADRRPGGTLGAGCKFVRWRSNLRTYPNQRARFLLIALHLRSRIPRAAAIIQLTR